MVLADWAAIAIANARLYEDAERRRVELERVVRGLQATASLSKELGGETDVRRVFELVVKRGRALVDARACVLLLAEDDRFVVADAAGEVPVDLTGRSIPLTESPFGEVLSNGCPASAYTRAKRPGVDGARGRGCCRAGLTAALTRREHGCSPSHQPSRSRSAVHSRRRADAGLIRPATAANAVADVRAIETQKRELSIAASEQERRRWARELHDETLQELGAVKMARRTRSSWTTRGDEGGARASPPRNSKESSSVSRG